MPASAAKMHRATNSRIWFPTAASDRLRGFLDYRLSSDQRVGRSSTGSWGRKRLGWLLIGRCAKETGS
jgi:hypothetical protein